MRSRSSAHATAHPQLNDFKNQQIHPPRALYSSSSLKLQRNALAILCVLLGGWILHESKSGTLTINSLRGASDCEFFFGVYRGHQYYSPESGSVGTPKCLVESKWLKLSQHSVRFPGSQTTFDDWMWVDYHDRINVLVEDEKGADGERRFLVFQQTKYALEGRESQAIIGGIIEPGETPEDAAKREVEEELNGLQCSTYHALGRYRTDVNRGMGWVNSFLATDCARNKVASGSRAVEKDEVGVADTERQDLESISLTELREHVQNGDFLEVQWSATVALALLHPHLAT
mmetsp:Transcript_56250/g.163085  ORF Transcript_56250/g.163085 Transcript_56250/m.163085 type:complete len:288 (+) Transcript_56250:85-948(+)